METPELTYNILEAAHRGDLEEVKAAVRENPDTVKLRHKLTGSTALHFAAACGNVSVVEYLLTCKGIDVVARDGYGRDPMEVAYYAGHDEIFGMVADAKYPVRLADIEGRMPDHPDYNPQDRIDAENADWDSYDEATNTYAWDRAPNKADGPT